MTSHMKPRLRVPATSVARFRENLKKLFREGRGRALARVIENLKPLLRGWINYFQLAEVKGVFEALDGWLRRRLRAILWRQWRNPRTRARKLMQRGVDRTRAMHAVFLRRGPWWNARAYHMHQACTTPYFRSLGLIPLIDQLKRRQRAS